MDKLELAALFQQKVKELRAKGPEKAKNLYGELLEWSSVIPAFPLAPPFGTFCIPRFSSSPGGKRFPKSR